MQLLKKNTYRRSDMSSNGEKKKRSGCRTALLLLLVILALIVVAGVIFFKVHEKDIKEALSKIDCTVPVGEAAPDFEVTTTDGETVSMNGLLEGKDALVVVLFATWCGPCEKEFPFMSEVYQANKDRISMIALDVDGLDNADAAKKYADEHNLAFPVAYADNLPESIYTSAYPTTFIVDRTGTIQFCRVGSIPEKETFEKIVGTFTGDNYQPRQLGLYSFYAYSNKNMVPGIEFSVTSESGTETYTTGKDGYYHLFTDKPENMKVKVISVPDGCTIDGTGETETGTLSAPVALPVK